jgi:hypothetical protein
MYRKEPRNKEIDMASRLMWLEVYVEEYISAAKDCEDNFTEADEKRIRDFLLYVRETYRSRKQVK